MSTYFSSGSFQSWGTNFKGEAGDLVFVVVIVSLSKKVGEIPTSSFRLLGSQISSISRLIRSWPLRQLLGKYAVKPLLAETGRWEVLTAPFALTLGCHFRECSWPL